MPTEMENLVVCRQNICLVCDTPLHPTVGMGLLERASAVKLRRSGLSYRKNIYCHHTVI